MLTSRFAFEIDFTRHTRQKTGKLWHFEVGYTLYPSVLYPSTFLPNYMPLDPSIHFNADDAHSFGIFLPVFHILILESKRVEERLGLDKAKKSSKGKKIDPYLIHNTQIHSVPCF